MEGQFSETTGDQSNEEHAGKSLDGLKGSTNIEGHKPKERIDSKSILNDIGLSPKKEVIPEDKALKALVQTMKQNEKLTQSWQWPKLAKTPPQNLEEWKIIIFHALLAPFYGR